MSGQLWKIMHKQSSGTSSSNTPPIMVKNEVDVIVSVENNQIDPNEVYYGRSSDRRDSHFNGRQGKINCSGRPYNNNDKTHSTDKKTKINPLGPEGNTTVCSSVAANSTAVLTLTIPKINMRTAKTGVIFPWLTSQWWVSSQNWRKTATHFWVRHFVLLFWIVVHLVPFAEQNGTNIFLKH